LLKTTTYAKNLAGISHTSRVIANFVPNFVVMATGVGRGEMRLTAFENPPTGAKISYASQVIANFVPNFVVVATGVDRGKMRLAAFHGPSPKTPYKHKNLAKNLLRKPSYSQFCPKFHGNGGQPGVNINVAVN